MEGQQSAEGGGAEEIKDGEVPEKVLIERDGRFELVNASDMAASVGEVDNPVESSRPAQANGKGRVPESDRLVEEKSRTPVSQISQPNDEQQPSPAADEEESTGSRTKVTALSGSTDEETTGQLQTSRDQSSAPPTSQDSVKPSTITGSVTGSEGSAGTDLQVDNLQSEDAGSKPGQVSSSQADHSGESNSERLHQKQEGLGEGSSLQKTEMTISSAEGPHNEKAGNVKSGSRVQIIAAEGNSPSEKPLTSISTVTLSQSSAGPRRQSGLANRAVSAPGTRGKAKEKEEEEMRLKKERNEAAFAVWLSKKNSELAKQRKIEKEKQQSSEVVKKEKKEQSEAAYQAWLAAKNKTVKIRPETTPTTRTSSSEEEKSAAFESWMSRKKRQQQLERELEERRNAEQEEIAKKTDPDIVKHAYQEWLHWKKVQAREEAKKKEQYRRSYFTQSKRLHQSLAFRFEGF